MRFSSVTRYLLIVLLLTLSGCSDDNETSNGPDASPTSQAPASNPAPNNNQVPDSAPDTTPDVADEPSNDTPKNCTPAEVAGQWSVTLVALGTSQTEVVTIEESDVPGNNTFTLTDGDITLSGTIDSSCRRMSGTATAGSISGTWSAVKL